eukprot:m.169980 g.169980  ORF g.169980 m.169980 type:complete len:166 (-) comp14514_c0_seq1:151-648(-)
MAKQLVAGVIGALTGAAAVMSVQSDANALNAHCQVPCGIYDDDARIETLREDTMTIAKSVSQIARLSRQGDDPVNLNQAVRWINTKEKHASDIISLISEYFLTQKVKPLDASDPKYTEYLEVLAVHHKVMVAAMRTKQTVDPHRVGDLAHAVGDLSKVYSKNTDI